MQVESDEETQSPEANNTSEEITFEEAEKMSKIVIYFRQLNKFIYKSGIVTFYFYTLVQII